MQLEQYLLKYHFCAWMTMQLPDRVSSVLYSECKVRSCHALAFIAVASSAVHLHSNRRHCDAFLAKSVLCLVDSIHARCLQTRNPTRTNATVRGIVRGRFGQSAAIHTTSTNAIESKTKSALLSHNCKQYLELLVHNPGFSQLLVCTARG
ncbi:hypothetical protein NEOLEDRAFT_675637 [Neolentinus lepideus HHB14362 ss-1]|uniref:Uncharacterized protein n=1 Tax=Neolentinus lepideus HHB14362 ss-1 TaxID=1314782 RepID=A0A165QCT5_9AGAM|nr:hypothetical protein NEOLEDRAFT_675637 [Neolentinus lepideus HHB14362 ss-1]